MKISQQLENREVPLCVVCNENPAREGCKTCSTECSKAYRKAYRKAYMKSYLKSYLKSYRKTDKYKEYRKAYQKTDKYKAYIKTYKKTYQKSLFKLKKRHQKEFKEIKDKLK